MYTPLLFPWSLTNQKPDNYPLQCLLESVPDTRQPILLRIYRDHQDLFDTNPGSSHNHQAWRGGLADHYADLLRLSWLEYDLLSGFLAARQLTLPFTLGSAQVALFCHDAEKVVVYGQPDDPRCSRFTKGHQNPSEKNVKEGLKWNVLKHWHDFYGLVLTDAELNAVKYTHGEEGDYRNDRRVMNELAAFIGNLDRASARIIYASGQDLG